MTTSGFQNASRLGRRSGALGISCFFFDGETSLVGLEGVNGGVVGRVIGGALQGERFLVGVGELQASQYHVYDQILRVTHYVRNG